MHMATACDNYVFYHIYSKIESFVGLINKHFYNQETWPGTIYTIYVQSLKWKDGGTDAFFKKASYLPFVYFIG